MGISSPSCPPICAQGCKGSVGGANLHNVVEPLFSKGPCVRIVGGHLLSKRNLHDLPWKRSTMLNLYTLETRSPKPKAPNPEKKSPKPSTYAKMLSDVATFPTISADVRSAKKPACKDLKGIPSLGMSPCTCNPEPPSHHCMTVVRCFQASRIFCYPGLVG